MASDVKYNPNCTNKKCEGGILVSRSGSTKICTFCNPEYKKPKAGSINIITLKQACLDFYLAYRYVYEGQKMWDIWWADNKHKYN